jgi:hypothetical protein
MGGFGSGWEGERSERNRVEDCLRYAVDSLAHDGLLSPPLPKSCTSQWTYDNDKTAKIGVYIDGPEAGPAKVILLHYNVSAGDGPSQQVIERIRLESKPLRFGGVRWYFQCPKCDNRVSKLYCPKRNRQPLTMPDHVDKDRPKLADGHRFLCRRCHRLIYQSTLDSRQWDTMARFLAKHAGADPEAVKASMRHLGRGGI